MRLHIQQNTLGEIYDDNYLLSLIHDSNRCFRCGGSNANPMKKGGQLGNDSGTIAENQNRFHVSQLGAGLREPTTTIPP
jgi:hypothetical protein